jgi:hypothetical protein
MWIYPCFHLDIVVKITYVSRKGKMTNNLEWRKYLSVAGSLIQYRKQINLEVIISEPQTRKKKLE